MKAACLRLSVTQPMQLVCVWEQPAAIIQHRDRVLFSTSSASPDLGVMCMHQHGMIKGCCCLPRVLSMSLRGAVSPQPHPPVWLLVACTGHGKQQIKTGVSALPSRASGMRQLCRAPRSHHVFLWLALLPGCCRDDVMVWRGRQPWRRSWCCEGAAASILHDPWQICFRTHDALGLN